MKKLLLALALVLTAGTANAEDGHVIKFDDVAWQEAGIEGIEMAILWGNEADGSAVYAFKFQPGISIPAHSHTNDYWGIAVQGKWVHIDAKGNEEIAGQDGFAHIRGGDLHGDRCEGPEVCINVLDFDGARDIAFPG